MMPAPTTAAPALATSRVRFKVVGLGVLLAMVTYLDRACIATLAPDIMRDLHLDKQQMSWVFSAFALAYALFEIPTAWWADQAGCRRVLTRIVLWWSAFTVATAGAFNLASLWVTRFLFGMGEAGAWPCAARAFSRWIPRRERGRVQGIFFAGAHVAGGLAPMVALALAAWVSWRGVFILFGLLGPVWAVVWYRWFRDEPSAHPAVSPAERALIVSDREADSESGSASGSWWRLLRQRNLLLLCLMYFPNTFAFYFCITWLPTYLREQHGFNAASLGFLAGLPLTLSVVSDLLGGVTTDALTARFGLRIGRAGVGAVAYLLAGGAMLWAACCRQPVLAALLIAVATAASMFALGAAWGTCLDIGANRAGVVSATMNTSGQVGSVLSPLVVTFLVHRFATWTAPLWLMGGLLLAGAVCWVFIDPHRRVGEGRGLRP